MKYAKNVKKHMLEIHKKKCIYKQCCEKIFTKNVENKYFQKMLIKPKILSLSKNVYKQCMETLLRNNVPFLSSYFRIDFVSYSSPISSVNLFTHRKK